MRFAVLHGPNLNRLGKRRPEKYGSHTLDDITKDVDEVAARLGVVAEHVQSNHEGELIDWLHERMDELDGIVINPAGLSSVGKGLKDTVFDAGVPVAVVHIAQLYRFEGDDFHDIFRFDSSVYVAGLGWRGYGIALDRIHDLVKGAI
ncbi:type II 3-dehydroquinate dehydratase [Saccharopolyspora sp. ASAGF58]|uniref:type II 3-dehydroquinate dehydratase n=1 Tax=Saccharopolyspora sp. ASAGF58 TaxID=2719023 RepID=UPI0014400780|nr:type II 3-dehydroquinate dehydratase [Saccharopolyspora sp. ASAGF58]QIZ37259.1 type II 3-dehydroquinate dehydratase [Saccharopolyspora sp. ASAGF58]